MSAQSRALQFPANASPRTWLITSAASPIAVTLIRGLLAHGDYVMACTSESDNDAENRSALELAELAEAFPNDQPPEIKAGSQTPEEAERGILRPISMDCRMSSQCRAAVAEVLNLWGRLDILFCCTSQAVVGTIEELGQSIETQTLLRDQFETNYFGMVNVIQAALPPLRSQPSGGHILILTGVTGHIGTPSLSVYCAASWALEGFCDSLAYEVAPFNIRVTIVQPNLEVNTLTNPITFVPTLPEQADEQPQHMETDEDDETPPTSSGLTVREVLRSAVSRAGVSKVQETSSDQAEISVNSQDEIETVRAPLSSSSVAALVDETVYAIAAIGGHRNPPARHIVGSEGVAAVKEKLKTVSEELEDFLEASYAVDIVRKERIATGADDDHGEQSS